MIKIQNNSSTLTTIAKKINQNKIDKIQKLGIGLTILGGSITMAGGAVGTGITFLGSSTIVLTPLALTLASIAVVASVIIGGLTATVGIGLVGFSFAATYIKLEYDSSNNKQNNENTSHIVQETNILATTVSNPNPSPEQAHPASKLLHITDDPENKIFTGGFTGRKHPESFVRVKDAMETFKKANIFTKTNLHYVTAGGATDEELKLVHSEDYIHGLKEAEKIANSTNSVFQLSDISELNNLQNNNVKIEIILNEKTAEKSLLTDNQKREEFSKKVSDLNLDFKNFKSKDVSFSTKTMNTVRYAAKAAIQAVDEVSKENAVSARALALVRPPGHHADEDCGSGFCVVNNVAIAAKHAYNKGYRKIAVIDFDAHHGNGTQNILTKANKTNNAANFFFFSTHWDTVNAHPGLGQTESSKHGFYPFNKNADKTVTEVIEGQRTVMNVPIICTNKNNKSDMRQKMMDAIEKDLVAEMDAFQPDLILVSAGFDAHKDDPYGMGLATEDFKKIGQIIGRIADDAGKANNKKVPIVSVLEGGYKGETIGTVALAYADGLGESLPDVEPQAL